MDRIEHGSERKMAFDAFISYSSKDKTAADAACAVLEHDGVRCWIAPRDITPGGEYGAAIIEAIDRCRVMVLIFTSSANDSQQMRREIERAVSKGIPIVPVRIEEVVPTKSLEYFLGAIHWLDALSPPLESHLRQLVDTVKAILQINNGRGAPGEGEARPSPAPVAVPRPDHSPASGASTQNSTQTGRRTAGESAPRRWLIPAVCAALLLIVAAAGGAWFYQHAMLVPAPPAQVSAVAPAASPAPAPPAPAAAPAPPAPAAAPAPPAPTPKETEALVPEDVPFIPDSARATIRTTYLPAPDYKALAIGSLHIGFITEQKDEQTARTAALEACKRVSGDRAAQCRLYAVGNVVVFKGGRPPMPPEPWVVRDSSIERTFVAEDVPLLRDQQKNWLKANYATLRKPKAVALTRSGGYFWYSGQTSVDEAVRRALEWCGFASGAACMILAIDDVFVVPVPLTMKPVGFFQARNNTAIAVEARDSTAHRLANATSGWSAVAIGANGQPGLGLRAAKEQDAIDGALADCRSRDRDCRVIAIGPFTVEPADAPKPASATR